MQKMWFRTILMTAVCLSVAACGKSKTNSSVGAPEAPIQNSDQKKDAQSGERAGDAKQKETPSGQGVEPAQNPADADKDGKGRSRSRDNSKAGDLVKPKVEEKPAGSSAGSAAGSKESQVKSEAQGRRASQENAVKNAEEVEKMMADARGYSGSAPDSLRELLMLEQSQIKSESQKLKNLRLAYSIQSAELKLNSQTGLVQVNVLISDSKSLNLQGVIRTGRTSAVLASSAKGASGEITCMDETLQSGSTCQTSLVEIRQGSAIAKIIFRETDLKMIGEFPDQNRLTEECSKIYDLLRFTEKKIIESNTLKSVVMESFEVINGKSGFKVLAVSNENQVIKLAGPLANPEVFPVLDTPADRTLSAEDLVDAKTGTLRRTQFNEALNDVRIVSNDGNGNIRMLVKMKVNVEGQRDFFHLYLERQVRPVRTQDVQLN